MSCSNIRISIALSYLPSSIDRNSTFVCALVSSRRSLGFFQPLCMSETCHCFSLCSPLEVAHFFSYVPDAVESATSPWYNYLSAIYGHVMPPLPIEGLREFNLWYHNDRTIWDQRVPWPMATCEKLRYVNSSLPSHTTRPWRLSPGDRRCPTEECERWRGSGPAAVERSTAFAELTTNGTVEHVANKMFGILVVVAALGKSRATLISRIPNASARQQLEREQLRISKQLPHRDAGDLIRDGELRAAAAVLNKSLGRAVYPSGSWVEVIRHDDRLVKVHAGKNFEGTVANCKPRLVRSVYLSSLANRPSLPASRRGHGAHE